MSSYLCHVVDGESVGWPCSRVLHPEVKPLTVPFCVEIHGQCQFIFKFGSAKFYKVKKDVSFSERENVYFHLFSAASCLLFINLLSLPV